MNIELSCVRFFSLQNNLLCPVCGVGCLDKYGDAQLLDAKFTGTSIAAGLTVDICGAFGGFLARVVGKTFFKPAQQIKAT